jgi:hypothetical protein
MEPRVAGLTRHTAVIGRARSYTIMTTGLWYAVKDRERAQTCGTARTTLRRERRRVNNIKILLTLSIIISLSGIQPALPWAIHDLRC